MVGDVIAAKDVMRQSLFETSGLGRQASDARGLIPDARAAIYVAAAALVVALTALTIVLLR